MLSSSGDTMASGSLTVEIARSVSTGDLLPRPQRLPRGYKNSSPNSNQKLYSGSPNSQKNNSRKKFRWHDPDTGYTLTAGGILFYDDQGVWVIGEKDKNGIMYTDIGGRYAFEDGNIWVTIRRELYEETYGICEMLTRDVMALSKKFSPIYVNGHNGTPVYACLTIPISEMNASIANGTFTLDPVLFDIRRIQTIKENPDVPVDYYSPCILTKLTYGELSDPKYRLSYRLKRILKYSNALSWRLQEIGSDETEEDSIDS